MPLETLETFYTHVSRFNPYLRTYGFTIIGFIVALANLIVFVILIRDRKIR